MSQSDHVTKVNKLLKAAIEAVSQEIEAVREEPAQDRLRDGERVIHESGGPATGYDYRFKTHQESIQYAEEVRAEWNGDEVKGEPVSLEDQVLTIHFDKNIHT